MHSFTPRTLGAALAATLCALSVGTGQAALGVTSTNPGRYQLAVPVTLNTVQVTFNQMLQTPPAGAVRVAGSMSGLHGGFVTIQDNVLTWHNLSEPFLAGEMVVLNLRSDIQGVTNESLSGGFYRAFTIASAPAAMSWSARQEWEASDIPYFLHGGDLDNDGIVDLAAPNEGTDDVSIFLNPGAGFFSSHTEYGVGDKPSSIFGEDFDNDGDQDLATADIDSGTMTVLRNNGDGTFQPGITYEAGLQCRQIHGGDFDGDNDIDLATTDHLGDRVFIWVNNGSGSFFGIEFGQVSNGPFAIRCGDLSGDGHCDIAVACQDADSLTVLTNNGVGQFSRTGTFRIADLPWCLNLNDFDGDGDADLVSVASFSNRILVLINDGTGAFPTRNLSATGSFPLGVYCADLDGDGDIDATSSNYSGGTVGVYRNNGAGVLTLQSTLPCQISGSYTWAHDLDGDNDLDLSVIDEEADKLFIWYNGAVPTAVEEPLGEAMLSLAVSPQPVHLGQSVEIEFRGAGPGPAVADILGVDGRLVRTLWSGSVGEADLRLTWDGTDQAGRVVSAGRYFARISSGVRYAARGITVLH
ncbi:MAG: VCBS repeat-containing protein [Candidatus Eisenbacteria bacterium]|nr:VCBS repeat-containing protein [Candidatus Eisenbacteria bacterium]